MKATNGWTLKRVAIGCAVGGCAIPTLILIGALVFGGVRNRWDAQGGESHEQQSVREGTALLEKAKDCFKSGDIDDAIYRGQLASTKLASDRLRGAEAKALLDAWKGQKGESQEPRARELISIARDALRRGDLVAGLAPLHEANALRYAPSHVEVATMLKMCSEAASDAKVEAVLMAMTDSEFEMLASLGSAPSTPYFDDPAVNSMFILRLSGACGQARREREARKLVGKAREAAQADRLHEAALLLKRGPKPISSGWDSSVKEVEDYLHETLNDPDSVKYVEWSDVVGTGEYWGVRVKYRARNAFGGYITKNQLARIQDGRVVSLVDFP